MAKNTTSSRPEFKAIAYVAEGTGAGYGAPAHQYEAATRAAFSNSPREARETALRAAQNAVDAKWEARELPAQIPVMETVRLYKRGRLIWERD